MCVCDWSVWRLKCFSSNLVHLNKRYCVKWVTCVRAFDLGNDFPAYQVTCYSGFGLSERQILFSDVKKIHAGSGVTEHTMVMVSPPRRSVNLCMYYNCISTKMAPYQRVLVCLWCMVFCISYCTVQCHSIVCLMWCLVRNKDYYHLHAPEFIQENGSSKIIVYHCAKKPVTTMLTYPWKCTVLHCNQLGNTWKPLVLMTRHFDYCLSASEGDNQSVRSSAPVVSRCFPGGYNVKLYISRGRLAWWLLAFLHSECEM